MDPLLYQDLGRLLRSITSLLTAETLTLEEVDACLAWREHAFADVWEEVFSSPGEKAVVECLIEEILRKSILLTAKAHRVRLEHVAQKFLS